VNYQKRQFECPDAIGMYRESFFMTRFFKSYLSWHHLPNYSCVFSIVYMTL